MLVVDVGQSGSRLRLNGAEIVSKRGKHNGETVLNALTEIFSSIEKIDCSLVALSCTGFGGVVPSAEPFGALCKDLFGADRVAVMDDGLAGFVGAINGQNGVALTIGGGVVSVGGRNGKLAHRDGLGSTFGDEGGGYWLGKLGLTKAVGARQGRGEDSLLLEYFKERLRDFDAIDLHNSSDVASLAIRSAKELLDAADGGSPTAIRIRDEGAYLLSQTVLATWFGASGSANEVVEIAIHGGLSTNRSYVELIQQHIAKTLPKAEFVSARGNNLDGATWVAKNMLEDIPPLLKWAHLIS